MITDTEYYPAETSDEVVTKHPLSSLWNFNNESYTIVQDDPDYYYAECETIPEQTVMQLSTGQWLLVSVYIFIGIVLMGYMLSKTFENRKRR